MVAPKSAFQNNMVKVWGKLCIIIIVYKLCMIIITKFPSSASFYLSTRPPQERKGENESQGGRKVAETERGNRTYAESGFLCCICVCCALNMLTSHFHFYSVNVSFALRRNVRVCFLYICSQTKPTEPLNQTKRPGLDHSVSILLDL